MARVALVGSLSVLVITLAVITGDPVVVLAYFAFSALTAFALRRTFYRIIAPWFVMVLVAVTLGFEWLWYTPRQDFWHMRLPLPIVWCGIIVGTAWASKTA